MSANLYVYCILDNRYQEQNHYLNQMHLLHFKRDSFWYVYIYCQLFFISLKSPDLGLIKSNVYFKNRLNRMQHGYGNRIYTFHCKLIEIPTISLLIHMHEKCCNPYNIDIACILHPLVDFLRREIILLFNELHPLLITT